MRAIETVSMGKAERLPGRFVVLWRRHEKQVAKVLSVNKAAKRLSYEIRSGSDKGKRFEGAYEPAQGVEAYRDEGTALFVAEGFCATYRDKMRYVRRKEAESRKALKDALARLRRFSKGRRKEGPGEGMCGAEVEVRGPRRGFRVSGEWGDFVVALRDERTGEEVGVGLATLVALAVKAKL